MSRLIAFAVALISSSLVVGCAKGSAIATDFAPIRPLPESRQARPSADVQVFLKERPRRSFREVALVEVQERRGNHTASQLLAALRERAAKEGCDGLIIIGDNNATRYSTATSSKSETDAPLIEGAFPLSEGDTTTTTNTSTVTTTLRGYRASCVVYGNQAIAKPDAS